MSKTNPSTSSRRNAPLLRRLRGFSGSILGLLWGLLTGLVVVSIPGVRRRRKLAAWASRTLLRLLGVRTVVHGELTEEAGSCVAVANHASYLDGILLTAMLPPDFSFVIKREMLDVPLVGLLLRRLDAVFVDRAGTIRGQHNGRNILDRAGTGGSIGIFPEGTFRPEPGLLEFRPGAFITAMRANRPVLPISIDGSRQILPAETWQLLPGTVRITIHPVEWPHGRGRKAREELVKHCRQAIMQALPPNEQTD